MTHEGQVFTKGQCTALYLHHVEVINDLIESFQMYFRQILNQLESETEIRSRQSEQAAYYENIIKNIDIVLQLDQVAHIHEGLPQVPLPRYVPSRDELKNNNNTRFIFQLAHGDADISNKETQIIHMEFIKESDAKLNHPDYYSRLWNIDDLTDMGFNITECSPIPTLGDTIPQKPVRSGTNTPVPTSTPRPVGGSCLHSSDPIPHKENAHMHNSFTDIAGPVELQKLTRLESNDKPMGSDSSALTGNTTLFYPGDIPFKN